MSPVVTAWMRSTGLVVKPEFQLPWGICDLVGATLCSERVEHRLKFRQRKPIGSITAAMLLLQIPDVESRRSIGFSQLAKPFSQSMPVSEIEAEVERLISSRFVVKTKRGNLQKLNGWMPLEKRLVAVELKLSRIHEVFRQAWSNLEFAIESYMAMPLTVAERVASNPEYSAAMAKTGVGLISVTPNGCSVLVNSGSGTSGDAAVRMYCVEKFWRSRSKDN